MRRGTALIGSILVTSTLLVACAPDSEAWFARTTSSASSRSVSSALTRRAERLADAASRGKSASSAAFSTGTPQSTYRIPILVYHHVRPQEGWAKTTWSWKMTVSPETFERQMQWLADKGYVTVTLDQLSAMIRGEIAMPLKPVIITFDDNNLNQYNVALPILEKHGQVAVFYLIAKYLDTTHAINRDRALDLIARGQDVQSHTMTHRVLTALSDDELDWELRESKRVLEELLGRPVLHVAYPGTMQNQRVRDHAKAAGYETATIMDPRNLTEKDDWMKWPRIMMTDDTNLEKVLP